MEYGLIGEHLGHSYSPEIHGQIADYRYELKEVPKDGLDAFMRAADFRAINVTIPYKQDVIPYLDSISDQAANIGAVNTIVNDGGKLRGYNTDFMGMRALALRLGLDFTGRKVLILGTGGTSRTAQAVAESLGAGAVYKVSRKGGSGDPVQERGAFRGVISYEEAAVQHDDAQIIINTTPSGMFPRTGDRPIDISPFTQLGGVMDAVYNPLRTNLILDAQERGIPAEGGLYMLAAQGVYACGLFLGKEMDMADIDRAFDNVLSGKRNIVLTGMPSCGKTTISGVLAGMTGLKTVDTDEMIIDRIGMEIADYFAAEGEHAFRDRESEVIGALSQERGLIIATGGGAVLRQENIRALKQNGIVVFLDRPLDKLITTDDRPLSSSREALKKRYDERIDIYRGSADVTVDASGSIDEVVANVLAACGLNASVNAE